MILRNKLTKETLNIPYSNFKSRFSKEIQFALDSSIRNQNNKQTFKFNKNFESDTEAFIVEILRNYLIYDRVEVFSKSNGTRDYVIKKGKNNIIEEIKMCTNYAQEDLNITIDDFSELAAHKWMLLNQNMNETVKKSRSI